MEALTALGVACNVMQIVSFMHETFSSCKEILKSGQADPSLEENVKTISVLTKSLRDSLKTVSNGAKPITEAENEL